MMHNSSDSHHARKRKSRIKENHNEASGVEMWYYRDAWDACCVKIQDRQKFRNDVV